MVQNKPLKRHPKRTDEEWMDIIQTCRTSGMSDKDWCTEHHISPSKFYYHIRRLRAKAYEIPDLTKSPVHHPKQEVIPFSVDGTCLQENRSPAVQERIVPDIPQAAGIIQDEPAIRLTIGHCCVDIFNNAAGDTIFNTLTVLQKLC